MGQKRGKLTGKQGNSRIYSDRRGRNIGLDSIEAEVGIMGPELKVKVNRGTGRKETNSNTGAGRCIVIGGTGGRPAGERRQAYGRQQREIEELAGAARAPDT